MPDGCYCMDGFNGAHCEILSNDEGGMSLNPQLEEVREEEILDKEANEAKGFKDSCTEAQIDPRDDSSEACNERGRCVRSGIARGCDCRDGFFGANCELSEADGEVSDAQGES